MEGSDDDLATARVRSVSGTPCRRTKSLAQSCSNRVRTTSCNDKQRELTDRECIDIIQSSENCHIIDPRRQTLCHSYCAPVSSQWVGTDHRVPVAYTAVESVLWQSGDNSRCDENDRMLEHVEAGVRHASCSSLSWSYSGEKEGHWPIDGKVEDDWLQGSDTAEAPRTPVSCMKAGFLDLPEEILLYIFTFLPLNSVMSCAGAHEKLGAILWNPRFLNSTTRKALRFPDVPDSDITYDALPENFEPLMELWFMTFNALSFTDSMSYLNSSNPLFPLACFHHSFTSWLSQAKGFGNTHFQEIGKDFLIETESRDGRIRHVVNPFIGDLDDVPSHVIKPLSLLALAFHAFIDSTISSFQHLCLRPGTPHMLSNVWHRVMFPGLDRDRAILHSLEFVGMPFLESARLLPAMLIVFDAAKWHLWTGAVFQFPGCRFEETWSCQSMDLDAGLDSVRQTCEEGVKHLMKLLKHPTVQANSQRKRQLLYPGICHLIHKYHRHELLTMIDKQLFNVLVVLENGGQLDALNDMTYNQDTMFYPELLTFMSLLGTLSRQSCSSVLDSMDFLRRSLYFAFEQEIRKFFCGMSTHEIVCPKCSQVWFPTSSSQTECIESSLAQTLPLDCWPVHLLKASVETISRVHFLLIYRHAATE